MTLFDISGKVAIVTGSSRGIGKAIAHRLAEHGASVVISSRKAVSCDEAAAEINAAVRREAAIAIASSLSPKRDLQRLVAETQKRLGSIDILVCNAASNPHFGSMATISDEQFSKTLQNNIISNHWLAQMVAPQMIAGGGGAIIIVSSIGGLKGRRDRRLQHIESGRFPARVTSPSSSARTSASTASLPASSRPISPGRFGRTRQRSSG